MPPPQCPECGRFLSKAFMAGLTDGSEDCPRCEASLTADRFDPEALPASVAADETEPLADPDGDPDVDADVETVAEQIPEPPSEGSEASVRPPDLPPTHVDAERDVLEGWDRPDAEVIDLLERRASVGGADPAAVIGSVLGAGLAGGVLGAIVARNHRPFGAVVGTLAGASGAMLGMRLFEDA